MNPKDKSLFQEALVRKSYINYFIYYHRKNMITKNIKNVKKFVIKYFQKILQIKKLWH